MGVLCVRVVCGGCCVGVHVLCGCVVLCVCMCVQLWMGGWVNVCVHVSVCMYVCECGCVDVWLVVGTVPLIALFTHAGWSGCYF